MSRVGSDHAQDPAFPFVERQFSGDVNRRSRADLNRLHQRPQFGQHVIDAGDQRRSVAEQVVAALDGFQTRYDSWMSKSAQVFELRGNGDYAGARAILNADAEPAFAELREVYDRAGEAASAKIHALETATLARANVQEYAVIGFSIVIGLITLIVALVGPLMMSRASLRSSALAKVIVRVLPSIWVSR